MYPRRHAPQKPLELEDSHTHTTLLGVTGTAANVTSHIETNPPLEIENAPPHRHRCHIVHSRSTPPKHPSLSPLSLHATQTHRLEATAPPATHPTNRPLHLKRPTAAKISQRRIHIFCRRPSTRVMRSPLDRCGWRTTLYIQIVHFMTTNANAIARDNDGNGMALDQELRGLVLSHRPC